MARYGTGDLVKHKRYGCGVITESRHTKIKIRFDADKAERTFLASEVKLETIAIAHSVPVESLKTERPMSAHNRGRIVSKERKPSYWEMLRDPRWQQKRLKIMERDGWECTNCGTKDETLNVHHSYYERGCAPWEYPDDSLHTLCEYCHGFAEQDKKVMHREIGKLGFDSVTLIIGCLRGLQSLKGSGVKIQVDSYEVAGGIGLIWGLTAEVVLSLMSEGVVTTDALLKARRESIPDTNRPPL